MVVMSCTGPSPTQAPQSSSMRLSLFSDGEDLWAAAVVEERDSAGTETLQLTVDIRPNCFSTLISSFIPDRGSQRTATSRSRCQAEPDGYK